MSDDAPLPAAEPETDLAPRAGGTALTGPLAVARELGPGGVVALGGVALALLAFLAYLAARAMEPPYEIIFANLALDEARAIAQRLDGIGAPYRLSDDGSAILAPADDALRLRMTLAEDGLPTGGSIGYEIFDRGSALGTTDFLSNVNLRRALEGELARTIASMRAVRAARVHIVQPRRQLFERERESPTAAIALTMQPGASLGARQVAGVRNLVASATPGLSPEDITIVDDRGALLARGRGEDDAMLATADEERRIAHEERLKRKVIQLLERSVGPGLVEAEVTVEMNFDHVTTTTENFDPDGQVALSTETIEETSERDERAGDDQVTVTQNLPTNQADGGAGGVTAERSGRLQEIVNFDNSKTVTSHVRRGGEVTRISVAVQVDGLYDPAEDGPPVYRDRPEEEIAQLTALVQSAVGFDAERGDVVQVVSRPLAPLIEEAPIEESLFAFTRDDVLRVAELAFLAISTLFVLLLVVRPLIKRIFAEDGGVKPTESAVLVGPTGKPVLVHGATGAAISVDDEGSPVVVRQPTETLIGGPTDDSVQISDDGELLDDDDEMMTLRQIQGQVRASLVRDVAEIIDETPDAAVRIIRNWMHDF